jgi:hypothetical protein
MRFPRIVVLVPFSIPAILFLLFIPVSASAGQQFLTSGTSLTVPADWDSSNNTIEVIGGGGGGGPAQAGSPANGSGGGGGGAYSTISNLSLTPGNSVTYSVGSAGAANTAGGDTYFNGASCAGASACAKGGAAGGTGGGAGGSAASSVGTTKYNGGTGGAGAAGAGCCGGGGGAGGGGGGPNGAGNPGAGGASTAGGTGGSGGAGSGGAGGTGGGGGCCGGGSGGNGTEFDASHGSGGGGGGGAGNAAGLSGFPGGTGGNYGAGGGGGGGAGSGGPSSGGGVSGGQGLIVITYGANHARIQITTNTVITSDASVVGTVTKGAGTFMIDDPLDPKNKLLFHSFVESLDVKNIYDGTVLLDRNGNAEIPLPDYFLALNKDFRYLAQAMSDAMPDLHLAHGVHRRWWIFGGPVFDIAGGVPDGKISWQVTGIRKDPLIIKNPIIPEVWKTNDTIVPKGVCLFPPLCR